MFFLTGLVKELAMAGVEFSSLRMRLVGDFFTGDFFKGDYYFLDGEYFELFDLFRGEKLFYSLTCLKDLNASLLVSLDRS